MPTTLRRQRWCLFFLATVILALPAARAAASTSTPSRLTVTATGPSIRVDALGASLTLGATEVALEDQQQLVSATTESHLQNGFWRIDRRTERVVEEVIQDSTSVRQQWKVSERPTHGAFRVRVPIAGARWLGYSQSGHRFRVGQRTFQYGLAMWIDAAGTHTPIDVVWDGAALVMTVPPALLQESHFPARLDPDITAAITIGEPASGPGPGVSGNVVSTRLSSGEVLAIWDTLPQSSLAPGLQTRRLNADGTPSAPSEGINTIKGSVRPSSAACHPNRCLLVLQKADALTAVWLDGVTGADVGVGPQGISSETLTRFIPKVFANAGGDFTVLFSTAFAGSSFGNTDVWSVTLDDAGSITAPATKVLTGNSASISTASFGSRRLAVYSWPLELFDIAQAQSVYSAAIDAHFAEAVEVNGNLLVVWAVGNALRAQWLDGAFAPMGPQLLLGSSYVNRMTLRAHNGIAYVAWGSGSDIRVRALNPNGTTSPLFNVGLASTTTPSIGGGLLSVVTPSSNPRQVTSLPLQPTGLGAPQLASTTLRTQDRLTLTADGGGQLLATWRATRISDAGVDGLAAIRLDSVGNPVGNELYLGAFEDAFHPSLDTSPTAVAAGANEWHVYRSTLSGGVARWTVPFDPALPLPPVAFHLPPSNVQDDPLAAWAHGGSPIVAMIQTPTVCVGSCPPTRPVYRDASASHPSVHENLPHLSGAAWGSRSLIVASRLDAFVDTFELNSYFLNDDFTETDLLSITSPLGDQDFPSVAVGSTMAFVAWVDTRGGGRQIYGSRLDATGASLDPDGIPIATKLEAGPPKVVALDSRRFLVAWLGQEAGAPPRVFASVVDTEGKVLDADGINLSASSTGPATGLTLATPGPGLPVAIGFTEPDLPRSEGRAYMRTFGAGSAGGATCAEDNACASRICEDSVCCEQRCGSCEVCGGDGTCQAVTSSTDDSCFGDFSCSENGQCLKANGQTCDATDDCASGFCIDGLCCNAACDEGCVTCSTVPGVCAPLECGNYTCSDERICLNECRDTADCAVGSQCDATGSCVPISPASTDGADDGCGCRVTGQPPGRNSSWPFLLALGLLGVAIPRRRMRREVLELSQS